MTLKFVIYSPELDYRCGGVVVLHKLAHDLITRGLDVKLLYDTGKCRENPFCNAFASPNDIDDDTIVLYPEIVKGNPLEAKHNVRWILCDLGIHAEWDIFESWNPGDLVFHYSSFNKRYKEEAIEILCTSWMDPSVINFGLKRSGSCFLMKKASKFHSNIEMIHPQDSVSIEDLEMEEIVRIFNRKEFFYSYDPYTFYDLIALRCGCIPVICPIAGLSKETWAKTRASFDQLTKIKEPIAGLAYGISDIPYAKSTLHLADQQRCKIEAFEQASVDRFVSITQSYFKNLDPNLRYKTVKRARSTLNWSIPFWKKWKRLLQSALKKR